MDFQGFYRGDVFDAYTFLGAHTEDDGTVFRTYAPAAKEISVICECNGWQEFPMHRIYDGQFWECRLQGAKAGEMYKYRVHQADGRVLDRADPYGFYAQKRPESASVIVDLQQYTFHDAEWMAGRKVPAGAPFNIYEVHAGSWRRKKEWIQGTDPADGWLNYRELADALIPYLVKNHYTHVELMPLAEYPSDESWGYQGTGFYAATSRYGSPDDLKYLIDRCHQSGIGVLLDVVMVHFAVNDYGLWDFDGTPLYSYPHPAVGYSEWGSCNFIHSRGDVRSFLQSSCLFWLKEYHFDGLRFDAVSNLIFWQGDANRGENKDAIAFLQHMNAGLKKREPTAVLIAEDSTVYGKTTAPVSAGGLGFDYKWNMGWMNDTLSFLEKDQRERRDAYSMLTHTFDYAFTEHFVLPISHDEVVHGKHPVAEKMNGFPADRLRQMRMFYLYMYVYPGAKLDFMGNELGEDREWDEKRELDWRILEDPPHRDYAAFRAALHAFYQQHSALWEDDRKTGFSWIDREDAPDLIIAFERRSRREKLLCLFNFSDHDEEYDLPDSFAGEELELLFESSQGLPDPSTRGTVFLGAYSGKVYRIDR